ncbi:MAG TPA: hypothetical protein VMR34_01285 [Candidatus Saccharimonadales bacterium]|nr:hypothetical protein [Candidatus Saccharimonadales bacterium]
MSEYLPPCFSGKCDRFGDEASDINKRLRQGMAECIIGAGGASLLEVTMCPMDALMKVGPEQTDPDMAEIRSNLGITGYFEGSDDLF